MGLLLRGNTRSSVGVGGEGRDFQGRDLKQGLAWPCGRRAPSTRSCPWCFPGSRMSGDGETRANPILSVGPVGHVALGSSQSPGFRTEEDR